MTSMTPKPQQLGSLLIVLGENVRDHIIRHRDLSGGHKEVAHEGGDSIFAIDRKVEPVIVHAIEKWPNELKPLIVIAEGFGQSGVLHFGQADQPIKYRLLIDPIDGTRNIMYDKRAAWFLATIAPDHGWDTRLSHSIASSMVELPTSKQTLADSFLAIAGSPLQAIRSNLLTGEKFTLRVGASSEPTLLQGFGQVSNFFPGTKKIASDLMEFIAERTIGKVIPGHASIFDDQYISTGGQLVELLMGHDRFCCDLRPLFYDILERHSGIPVARGLECHPYDMAGLLVAQSAGVILTDGRGAPLDAQFNTTSGVHWCGYANKALQSLIEPAIADWLSKHM